MDIFEVGVKRLDTGITQYTTLQADNKLHAIKMVLKGYVKNGVKVIYKEACKPKIQWSESEGF